MSFVHLHVHSEYSLLEASLRVKALAKQAAKLGMPAVALSDNGNMYGAIEFYFACVSANIRPILGLEIQIVPNRHEKSLGPIDKIVLLAQNLEGYQNLCRISTAGFHEGFYYKPRVDLETIRAYSDGVICLSGGYKSEVTRLLLSGNTAAAQEKVAEYKSIFGDRYYLEICRTGLAEWNRLIPLYQALSRELGVLLVATNDVHYLERDDQIAQDVLVCIGSNRTLSDQNRDKLGTDQFFLKSPEQMALLFHDMPEVVSRTLEIADRCRVDFQLKDEKGKPIYHLPSYPTHEGRSIKEEIEFQAQAGFRKRYANSEEGQEIFESEIYRKRLEFELSVIDRMGFNGYFLIVADFINWAKENGIPVGPGRGSGAGSLVAYSLGITDLDPVKHKLLFERFLNPERISMPDFDIDFCMDRRGEVIEYVTKKYGAASVSQIVTFGKLQTKAALKDVGRVLGMSFPEVNAVTGLIPEKLGISISEALEMEPRLREQIETNPLVATLFDLAKKVEGLVRHAGIHAAGVIIADGNLVMHAPLSRGAAGETIVQYDMKHAEKIGLIKFDFLGLKTLTHLRHASDLVRENRGIELKPEDVSIDDGGIYDIIARGDTAGIFQFEGEGITDAIRKIKPSHFFDIVAINALYRPGPMAMIPEFAKRKSGESVIEYLLDPLREILEETYGIIVYQEQVMGIASLIAGYSLGEADMLRRAMGKKIKEEMDQHRERFLSGAQKKGFDKKKSEELFELMYKFADYGFNKSHAAAYCVIAAQTAFFKHHYPVEFFAALLTTELGDTDKVVKYVKDASKRGIEVRPPHVNASNFSFSARGEKIFFGLGGIKGVGENAADHIIEVRESLNEKTFASVEDFFQQVDVKRLNKKVIESLIKAGAFDGMNWSRAQLMAGYSQLVDASERDRREKLSGQWSLFEMMSKNEVEPLPRPKVTNWTRGESLKNEKEVLGFFLSSHPLQGYEKLLSVWTKVTTDDLTAEKSKTRVLLGGVVSQLREAITRKGTRMAFGRFEDLYGSCELVVFPDTFAKHEMILKADEPLLIGGEVEVENGNAKIKMDSAILLRDAVSKLNRIRIYLNDLEDGQFTALKEILRRFEGKSPVEFALQIPEEKRFVIIDQTDFKGLTLNHLFFEEIHETIGHTRFLDVQFS